MTRRAAIAVGSTAALLTALLLAVAAQRVAERGRFARAYSTYGSGPQGTRGLYLLASSLGFHVARWSQDLARLPEHATLVALGGCKTPMARPLSRYERTELLRWVTAGGVLIVAGAREYLPPGLGVAFQFQPQCASSLAAALSSALAPDAPDAGTGAPDAGTPQSAADGGAAKTVEPQRSPPTAADAEAAEEARSWGLPMAPAVSGLPIVPFKEAGHLTLDDEASAEVLLAVPPSDRAADLAPLDPLLVAVHHGHGRVVVLASASMLQNVELSASDGGTLFARLLRHYAGSGPVLFDEYHLGMGERRTLMQYLRQLGAMPLLAQLSLLALCVLLRAGARLGRPQPPKPAQAAGTASFVTALGHLYEQAGDAKGALRLIARAALSRIARHHGLPNAPANALEQALTQRGASDAAQAVREIIAAVSSSGTPDLPALVARIDAALDAALSGLPRVAPDAPATPEGPTR